MRHGQDLAACAADASGKTGLLEGLAFAVLLLFCFEMTLGGPGFWGLGPLSVRKVLFAITLLSLGICCVGRRYVFETGSVLLLAAVALLLSVWILLIPGGRDMNQIRLAVSDAAAFSIIAIAVLAYEFLRRNPRYWVPLVSAVHASLVLVAMANIVLWVVGFSGENGNELAQAISLWWFTLGNRGAEPPLYVGGMPDGFFRAMWITAILYVPAFLFSVALRRWWTALLFALALFAAYTRSLWLVTALGVLFALLISSRQQAFLTPRVMLLVLVASVVAGAVLASTLPLASLASLAIDRLVGTFTDVSAQERFDQIEPLLAEWQRSPLFGAGFGASAFLIRSEGAPYSYELTGLALLMKLGIVGITFLFVGFCVVWGRATPGGPTRTPAQSAALASILALVGAGLTNPLLFNSVGFFVLSFLFLFLFLSKGKVDAA